MKVLVVFGTRPEAIKMAPVVKALRLHSGVETKILATAQHRQMLDQVNEIFGMKPDMDLDLMRPNQDLAELTARIINGVKDALREWKADWVFVQGDTTTAFSAALAAFYEKVKVAHVEAGLRTGDMMAPWPEEMNRRLITPLASLHFPPTERSAANLKSEGVPDAHICVTGNTVIDSLLSVSSMIDGDEKLRASLAERYPFPEDGKKLVLVTGHRRESFGDGFRRICQALGRLAERGDVQIVYPVHLNPNVQAPVNEILSGKKNVALIEPVDYVSFVYLMKRSYMIITDSGGVQEEAPSLGKPVLVMRSVTERPEGVDAGTVKIVGDNADVIVGEAERLLNDAPEYSRMSELKNPYGDGRAGLRIAERLLQE